MRCQRTRQDWIRAKTTQSKPSQTMGVASGLDQLENLTLDWRFLLAGARPAPPGANYRSGRTFAVPGRCRKVGLLTNPAVHTVSKVMFRAVSR